LSFATIVSFHDLEIHCDTGNKGRGPVNRRAQALGEAMGKLDGRVALVTGAARGIGRAVARALAREGAVVAVTDVDSAGATETARAIVADGGAAWPSGLDVSDRGACEAMPAGFGGELGPLSILVNNAGIIVPGRVGDEGSAVNWDRTIAVNLTGPFNMCRAFHPQLRETRGSVINIASIRSFVAAGNAAAYAASKGGVMQLTKALAVEWGDEGIRVNAIAPGFVHSDLVPPGEKTPQRESAIVARTPLGRQGEPDEIGGAAVFLASDEARFVTGAVIPVDGGYLAG
jgi:NAD(P)-dependent dehydrogenase (short-subunit alcohol dehydrogenase family)